MLEDRLFLEESNKRFGYETESRLSPFRGGGELNLFSIVLSQFHNGLEGGAVELNQPSCRVDGQRRMVSGSA